MIRLYFSKDSNPFSKPNSEPYILIFFIILISSINLYQIIFLPHINLAEGLGYDGVWYNNPANEFIPRTDNYHIFRIFPATCVFLIDRVE